MEPISLALKKRSLTISIFAVLAVGCISIAKATEEYTTWIAPVAKSISVTPAGPVTSGNPVKISCVFERSKTVGIYADETAMKFGPGYYLQTRTPAWTIPDVISVDGHIIKTFNDPEASPPRTSPAFRTSWTHSVSWTPPKDINIKSVTFRCVTDYNGPYEDVFRSSKSITVPFNPLMTMTRPAATVKLRPPSSTRTYVPPSPCRLNNHLCAAVPQHNKRSLMHR